MPDQDRSVPPARGGTPDPLPVREPARLRRLPEDWVGALTMALLTLITFVNVLVRYFTSESFAWTEEISIWLMVVVTMVAASAAVVRDRHIRIEIFFLGGSATRRRRLAVLSSVATVGTFLLLFGLGLRLFWDDYRYEVTSPGIGVPQWWYTVWLPLLALAIAARSLHGLLKQMRE